MAIWNNIKQTAEIIVTGAKFALRQLDPKQINKQRAELTKLYKEWATSGVVEVATRESSNPKLAQLAHDLEEMLLHPLSKKGLAGKPAPKIYILENLAPTAYAKSREVIEFSRKALDICHPKELKGIAGHELGHILRGNLDATIAMPNELASNHTMERGADRLGTILSGEPEAMKTGLRKVSEVAKSNMLDLMTSAFSDRRFLKKYMLSASERAAKYGNRTYPSIRSREHSLDKLAAQMATPEGRSFVEAEEMRLLEKIHGPQK